MWATAGLCPVEPVAGGLEPSEGFQEKMIRRLATEIGIFSDFVAMDATVVLDLVAAALEKGERLHLRHSEDPMNLEKEKS